MPHDLALQVDISTRLLVAAILGALVGLEREVHGHQAGMRTHMLVSLGSAIFTVLSIYGFTGVAGTVSPDPTRIAAQIVSGIGFLGAGAILKFGTNIRGLTTAASLWVIAAVGLAAGAGDYIVAVVGSTIAILALWPLHSLVQRFERRGAREVRLRLRLARLETFARISQILLEHHIEIVSIRTTRVDSSQEMDLDLRLPRPGILQQLLTELGRLEVEVETMTRPDEA